MRVAAGAARVQVCVHARQACVQASFHHIHISAQVPAALECAEQQKHAKASTGFQPKTSVLESKCLRWYQPCTLPAAANLCRGNTICPTSLEEAASSTTSLSLPLSCHGGTCTVCFSLTATRVAVSRAPPPFASATRASTNACSSRPLTCNGPGPLSVGLSHPRVRTRILALTTHANSHVDSMRPKVQLNRHVVGMRPGARHHTHTHSLSLSHTHTHTNTGTPRARVKRRKSRAQEPCTEACEAANRVQTATCTPATASGPAFTCGSPRMPRTSMSTSGRAP